MPSNKESASVAAATTTTPNDKHAIRTSELIGAYEGILAKLGTALDIQEAEGASAELAEEIGKLEKDLKTLDEDIRAHLETEKVHEANTEGNKDL